MLLFWSVGGFILYKTAKGESDDFMMKHMIASITVLFVIGLIPILNIIGFLFGCGVIIMFIMNNDDEKYWWNKPAVKKTK